MDQPCWDGQTRSSITFIGPFSTSETDTKVAQQKMDRSSVDSHHILSSCSLFFNVIMLCIFVQIKALHLNQCVHPLVLKKQLSVSQSSIDAQQIENQIFR